MAKCQFCQPTSSDFTSLSTQHVRPSGFSGWWSDGLELTARWDPACDFDSFKLFIKTICLVFTSAISALEAFKEHYACYKFTFYLLIYLLMYW